MVPWQEQDEFLRELQLVAGSTMSRSIRRLCQQAHRDHVEAVESAAIEHGHDAFPLLPEAGQLDGEFPVGVTPVGVPIALPAGALCSLTVILGPPGVGKSVLCAHLVNAALRQGVWVFTTEVKLGPDGDIGYGVPLLSPEQAAMTLAEPPGFTMAQWLTNFLWLLESTVFIAYGAQHIRELCDSLQTAADGRSELCCAQLAWLLHKRIRKESIAKQRDQLQTAALALSRLSQGDGGLFSSIRMVPWAHRLDHSHGLCLRGLPGEACRIAVLSTLMAFIGRQYYLGDASRRLAGLAVLEDARPIVRSLNRHQTSGTEPFQQLYDTGQAAGLGMVLVVQSLSEIPQSLLSSCNVLLLCGPIEGSDVQVLRSRLELTEEQASHLIHQERFNALCHVRSGPFTWPFPIQLPAPGSSSTISSLRAERAARKSAFVGSFNPHRWEPPREQVRKQEDNDLDAPARRCLAIPLDRPWLLQSEIADQADVRGRAITEIRDRLVQKGLIRVHHLNRLVLWEPTTTAAQMLDEDLPTLKGKGGFGHRWLQARIAAWLKLACPRVETEHQWKGGRIDVYAETDSGDLLAYEVCLSLKNIDDVLAKLRTFLGPTIVVCVDKKAAAKVKRVADASGLFLEGAPPQVIAVSEIVKQTKAVANVKP